MTRQRTLHVLRLGSIRTDESERQSVNKVGSRYTSFEPDSNVTIQRDWHRSKQNFPSTSTDEGMQIDDSDEHSENPRSLTQES
jgi:hypothetical protein